MKQRIATLTGVVLSALLLVYFVSRAFTSKYLSLYVFAAGFAGAVQVGCWLFLLARSDSAGQKRQPQRRTRTIALSVFLVILGVAVLELGQAVTVLPTLYFILVALLASVAGLLVVTADSEKDTRLALLPTMVVAALTSFSFYWLNPYPYASDVAFLYHGIEFTVATGSLPTSAGWYLFYPFFIGYDSAAVIASGLPTFQFGIFNCWIMFGSTLFLYLATKELFGSKVAVLAALMFASSNLLVRVTAGTLGFGLFIDAMYPAFMIVRHRRPAWHVIFWINAVMLIMVHPSASMAFLALLGGFRLTQGMLSKQPLRISPRNTHFLAFSIAFVGYSIYIVYPFFARLIQSLFPSDFNVGNATTTYVSGTAPLGLVLQLVFGYLSLFLLTCLGTLGFLWVVKRGTTEQRSLGLVTGLLILPPLASFATNNFNIEPSRTLQFLMMALTILGAFGLWKLSGSETTSSRSRGVVLVVGLVFIASFSGTISYLNGNSNSTLSSIVPSLSAQTTAATLQARLFVNRIPSNSHAVADVNTLLYILGPADRTTYPSGLVSLGLLEPSIVTTYNETYFFLDTFGLSAGSYTQGGAVILGTDFADKTGMNTSPLFSIIYSNGDLLVYLKARGRP
jgi:hypothetical protein